MNLAIGLLLFNLTLLSVASLGYLYLEIRKAGKVVFRIGNNDHPTPETVDYGRTEHIR